MNLGAEEGGRVSDHRLLERGMGTQESPHFPCLLGPAPNPGARGEGCAGPVPFGSLGPEPLEVAPPGALPVAGFPWDVSRRQRVLRVWSRGPASQHSALQQMSTPPPGEVQTR